MYNCPICTQSFKKLNKFQNHRSLCELLKLAKCRTQTDMVAEKLPSVLAIWDVMKQLLIKHEKLEAEFQECRAWIKRQKKKFSIVDWLNENCKPKKTYKIWLNSIKVGQEEVQLIFKHNYTQGMFYIIQNNLDLSDEHNFPIRAFNQKKHVLFVFEDSVWKMLDYKQTKCLIRKIHKKLQLEFKVWESLHPKIVDNIASNEWELNLQKINGGKHSYDVAIRKINIKLYEYLKFNLKSQIQYEFV